MLPLQALIVLGGEIVSTCRHRTDTAVVQSSAKDENKMKTSEKKQMKRDTNKLEESVLCCVVCRGRAAAEPSPSIQSTALGSQTALNFEQPSFYINLPSECRPVRVACGFRSQSVSHTRIARIAQCLVLLQ